MLRQGSGLQVDADSGHQEICQDAQHGAQRGDQDNRYQRKYQMALVVQICPPRQQAREFPAVGDNDNQLASASRREYVSGQYSLDCRRNSHASEPGFTSHMRPPGNRNFE